MSQDAVADSNKVAEEVIGTMRTVRSFASEKRECSRYEKDLDRLIEANKVGTDHLPIMQGLQPFFRKKRSPTCTATRPR